MPGPFPTPLHIAQILRDKIVRDPMRNHELPLATRASAPIHEAAPHDVRRFDMTLNDGRVYRVRVSDITPERES